MSFQVELPPVSEERLRATAEWIQRNVHPVANLVEQPESGEPPQPFEVRSHQVEALAREWQAREEGQNRALGHLATGGGKTTIAVIDAMKYREECAQMDVPVIPRYLYVSHKHEINEQAAKRFRRFMPDADIEFFDTRKAARRPDADFTFATIQSLYTQLHTFDPEDFESIFWDEAHHLEAVTFKRVLEYFRPLFESAATATVERMDRKDIRDYWGEVVYSKGLPDGIAEGWLADVEYHIVFDKALTAEIAKGFNPKTLKEIEGLFEKRVSTEALASSIKEEIKKLELKDPKTLVFCESVEEADEMAQLLDGVPYHSYTQDRPKILHGLRSGAIKVVTAKDMFNEGVDIPDVEVVVFLRTTKSGPLFEQQLGRGLRKISGKNKVYVLDFVANIERIAKVRELNDAVQKAVGDKDGDLDVTDSTSCGGGITVHSKHSEFDFDTMTIDLLDKWETLKGELKDATHLLSLTNDELVELALELSPGIALGSRDLKALSKEDKFVSTGTVIARFGSILNFQEACGFEIRSTRTMSNDDIVARALNINPDRALGYKEINELSKQKLFPSMPTIIGRFGSLDEFQKACGFEHTTPLRTRGEILERALSLKPSGPLTTIEINKLCKEGSFVSWGYISKVFGSLPEFQKACGFEPADRRVSVRAMTNEELVATALEISPDIPLGAKEIALLSKEGRFVGASNISKRFGSIIEFQKACGFEPSKSVAAAKLTNEGIITKAKQLKADGILTAREIVELSKQGAFVSAKMITNRFGSIKAFQVACEQVEGSEKV